jgi:flagellar basal-body rod modification protein FlgD
VNIGGIASSTDTSSSSGTHKTTLDSASFMQLLVAELAGQNPTSPVDDKDLFNQIATLTSVQGISEMRTATQFTRAQGLIGHKVDYYDSDGQLQTGVVTKITFGTDSVELLVGDNQVGLSDIATDYGAST